MVMFQRTLVVMESSRSSCPMGFNQVHLPDEVGGEERVRSTTDPPQEIWIGGDGSFHRSKKNEEMGAV